MNDIHSKVGARCVKEFKNELAALLEKYDADIWFTCSLESSNVKLYESHLVVVIDDGSYDGIESDLSGWTWKCSIESLRKDE